MSVEPLLSSLATGEASSRISNGGENRLALATQLLVTVDDVLPSFVRKEHDPSVRILRLPHPGSVIGVAALDHRPCEVLQ